MKEVNYTIVNYAEDYSQLSFIFSKNSLEDLDKMKNFLTLKCVSGGFQNL